ncbi:VOC family protein [Rhizobium rhizogenes]|uniref:VOC family protein n=1 Tax=Rhizobium rhizogenes TaxID=359 RepID=UPI0024BD98D5|nr:VOC family protein [Rhizobium rhizogenes]MDJ1637701.1 VOC family protein [Rhizobium rhizogenes]
MKHVKSIGHVAVSVKDIERSLDFYVNKLGFEEMFRLEQDGRLWIVYLRITDTQYLEISSCFPMPSATARRRLPMSASIISALRSTISTARLPS